MQEFKDQASLLQFFPIGIEVWSHVDSTTFELVTQEAKFRSQFEENNPKRRRTEDSASSSASSSEKKKIENLEKEVKLLKSKGSAGQNPVPGPGKEKVLFDSSLHTYTPPVRNQAKVGRGTQ